MFRNYLTNIGLSDLVTHIKDVELNNFVRDIFSEKPESLTEEQIKNLYVYDVPKMTPDGACSIIEEKSEKPYDIAKILHLGSHWKRLKSNPQTIRLWRLNTIVHKIYELTNVDWFGIYKKVINIEGKTVLMKEAYEGLFSRAEFPLTREFAKKSNNSTVGISGKAIIIQDVATHAGPYYICDGKVNSEFCLPILDKYNDVVGIIDTEAFAKNHYSTYRLLQIAKVAFDLGQQK